jgi:hypothetical protein
MLSRWPWSRSAAAKKGAPDDEFASRVVVLAVLIGGVAIVFWQQIVGAAVFIGESDRLNTYLNCGSPSTTGCKHMAGCPRGIRRCSAAFRWPLCIG